MQTLVNAPVLGFDLVRLPGGARVAEVLLRAMAVSTDDELSALAAAARPGDDHDAAWLEVAAAEQRRAGVTAVAAQISGGEGEDVLAALSVLERAPIGSLATLLECVRTDVFAETWRHSTDGSVAVQSDGHADAVAVVCDAVAGSYLEDLLPAQTRRRLAVGWMHALRSMPGGADARPDLGPQRERVEALVERVERLDEADRRRLAVSAGRVRAEGAWAAAVHSASWAVFLADRVREAAAAQLLLVRALHAADVPAAESACGLWNVLSGAAQALVVADLLDQDTASQLLVPVLASLGPAALGTPATVRLDRRSTDGGNRR